MQTRDLHTSVYIGSEKCPFDFGQRGKCRPRRHLTAPMPNFYTPLSRLRIMFPEFLFFSSLRSTKYLCLPHQNGIYQPWIWHDCTSRWQRKRIQNLRTRLDTPAITQVCRQCSTGFNEGKMWSYLAIKHPTFSQNKSWADLSGNVRPAFNLSLSLGCLTGLLVKECTLCLNLNLFPSTVYRKSAYSLFHLRTYLSSCDIWDEIFTFYWDLEGRLTRSHVSRKTLSSWPSWGRLSFL